MVVSEALAIVVSEALAFLVVFVVAFLATRVQTFLPLTVLQTSVVLGFAAAWLVPAPTPKAMRADVTTAKATADVRGDVRIGFMERQ